MKKYMFLTIGFEKPSPDDMKAWGQWFESIADKTIDRGGFAGAREISKAGAEELPWGPESLTGYVLFNAESLDHAEQLASTCPVVKCNRVYEIRDHG